MKICVMYGSSMARRISVPDQIDLETLKKLIAEDLKIDKEFHLQIYDKDFETYCDLQDIGEVLDFSKLKVVEENIVKELCASSSAPESSNFLLADNLRKNRWDPSSLRLSISSFGVVMQQELSAAEELYKSSGKYHQASHKLKCAINDMLSGQLTKVGLYPSDTMYDDICRNFVSSFPFLKDSIGEGFGGLKISLKYKVQEIRRKIKINETSMNSGKRSKTNPQAPGPNKNVKKARRGEINFLPECPKGETEETLLEHKTLLIKESTKRDPSDAIISEKMSITFALRRKEICVSPTNLSELMKNWPTLFTPKQLREEMIRIVGIDIKPKVMKNCINPAFKETAAKLLMKSDPTVEETLQCIPLIFKDKWSFFSKTDGTEPRISDLLFSEDDTPDMDVLPPYATIIPSSNEGDWAIIAEGLVLVDGLNNFVTATCALISTYYACNLKYCEQGTKSMLFLQVALAEIEHSLKIPVQVRKLVTKMKESCVA